MVETRGKKRRRGEGGTSTSTTPDAEKLPKLTNGHTSFYDGNSDAISVKLKDIDLIDLTESPVKEAQKKKTKQRRPIDLTENSDSKPKMAKQRIKLDETREPLVYQAPSSLSAPAKAELKLLRDFVSTIQSRQCSQCLVDLFCEPFEPAALFKRWLDENNPAANPMCTMVCTKCSASTCLGCGKRTTSKLTNMLQADDMGFAWCCSLEKAFIVWVLLCGFDEKLLEPSMPAVPHTSSRALAYGGYAKTFKTGQSTGAKSGVGYGGSEHMPPTHHMPPVGSYPTEFAYDYSDGMSDYDEDDFAGAMAAAAQYRLRAERRVGAHHTESDSDVFVVRITKWLVLLLYDDDEDFLVLVSACLANSLYLERCAELLLNDVISDITTRHELYTTLLDFVQHLTLLPQTYPLIHEGRRRKKRSVPLAHVSKGISNASGPSGKLGTLSWKQNTSHTAAD